jgi:hypothetical protein
VKLPEWWAFLEENKEDLCDLILGYHPGSVAQRADYYAPITAPRAEAACEVVREAIKQEASPDPLLQFKYALDFKRDEDIDTVLRILNQTWFGIPESRELVYRLVGFNALCDACSELEPPDDWEPTNV